jgi:hypothetical protein
VSAKRIGSVGWECSGFLVAVIGDQHLPIIAMLLGTPAPPPASPAGPDAFYFVLSQFLSKRELVGIHQHNFGSISELKLENVCVPAGGDSQDMDCSHRFLYCAKRVDTSPNWRAKALAHLLIAMGENRI